MVALIRKKFYRRKSFWVIIVLVLVFGIIGTDSDTPSESQKQMEDQELKNVDQVDVELDETSPDLTEMVVNDETNDNNSANQVNSSDSGGIEGLIDSVIGDYKTAKDYEGMVKNGTSNVYPGVTYEQAFSNFFKNPKWNYFESDDGEDVVEFSGKCMYQDVEVKVTWQFVLDIANGTFEDGYLAFNDVPQNRLTSYSLYEAIFEDIQD